MSNDDICQERHDHEQHPKWVHICEKPTGHKGGHECDCGFTWYGKGV